MNGKRFSCCLGAVVLLGCGGVANKSTEATNGADGQSGGVSNSGDDGQDGHADAGASGRQDGTDDGTSTGATGSDLPECGETRQQPPLVSVCGTLDQYSGESVALVGTVTKLGSDVTIPENCKDETGAPQDPDAFWFEVTNFEGKTVTAGISFPRLGSPVELDEESVMLSWAVGGGGFSPMISRFTLQDFDGNVLVYIGQGGDIGDLLFPSGVSAIRGNADCKGTHLCGSWQNYDLKLQVDGETAVLPYGMAGNVGPYRAVHGGYSEQTNDFVGMCNDWYVAYVRVGLVRLPQ